MNKEEEILGKKIIGLVFHFEMGGGEGTIERGVGRITYGWSDEGEDTIDDIESDWFFMDLV